MSRTSSSNARGSQVWKTARPIRSRAALNKVRHRLAFRRDDRLAHPPVGGAFLSSVETKAFQLRHLPTAEPLAFV